MKITIMEFWKTIRIWKKSRRKKNYMKINVKFHFLENIQIKSEKMGWLKAKHQVTDHLQAKIIIIIIVIGKTHEIETK